MSSLKSGEHRLYILLCAIVRCGCYVWLSAITTLRAIGNFVEALVASSPDTPDAYNTPSRNFPVLPISPKKYTPRHENSTVVLGQTRSKRKVKVNVISQTQCRCLHHLASRRKCAIMTARIATPVIFRFAVVAKRASCMEILFFAGYLQGPKEKRT